MKRKTVGTGMIWTLISVCLLMTMLNGCGRKNDAAGTDAPAPAVETTETAETPETSGPAEIADAAEDRGAGASLAGTWQTASMTMEADGGMAPEYHVRFTDADIVFGHMKDGEFVPDHSDPIRSFEEAAAGGWKIRAEAENGVRYTYQTCESDPDMLEYYETWNEEDFPELYRGGASLSRLGPS